VAVLGILMGAAVLSLNPASDQRALQGFAQRMAQRIELARDRAIQNNQEWGLYVQEEDYGIVAFDDISGRWLPQRQKPFRPDEPPSPVTFTITVQEGGFEDIGAAVFAVGDPGATGITGAEKEKNLPDVVFFSSGEASQFFIDVQFAGSNQTVRLNTDGFSPVRIQEANTLADEFR
jgi:type II secretory pathway pseudopilin PulG